MKQIFVVILMLFFWHTSGWAKNENFSKLPGNKYANGDVVAVPQVMMHSGWGPQRARNCKGLIYGWKTESSLW